MKNHSIIIFLAAYLLFIAAHAGLNGAPATPLPAPKEPEAPELLYQLEPLSVSRCTRSEDTADVELASCEYQLLTLTVANTDALSPMEAVAAQRNVETFTARMTGLLEEFEAYGRAISGDAQSAYEDGYFFEAYYDSVAASGSIVGEVVSIRLDRNVWTGGAHPNSYVSGYLFDLASGQFIMDPGQLADDPAAFQTGAAELLVEKADGEKDLSWGYWDDYRDIIRSWSSGVSVLDETGMTVVYAPYELGCYAIGEIELHLDWEELADLLGPGGLAKLGVELPVVE